MKHTVRALIAGALATLMLACVPLAMAFAQESASTAAGSSLLGTVVITKKGYQNVRRSATDSTTVFRVHYGERFLCMKDTGDGWYRILLPGGSFGYVSSDPENTTLLRGETDGRTLSRGGSNFRIETKRRAFVYSQPKSSAQTRRVSADGSTETTFYYPKGTEFIAFGKTTRGNRDWYLVQAINMGVDELAWLLATDVTLISGNPENTLIPAEWYD